MLVEMDVRCSGCGERPAQHDGRQKRQCRACLAAKGRARYAGNADAMREYKRRQMEARRRDPLTAARDRERRRLGKDVERERETKRRWLSRMRDRDPVRWRAFIALGHTGRVTTVDELVALWHAQAGRCALSGAVLSVDDAELDHKVPRSRGGSSTLENLQWTTRAANRAKHTLTNDEFRALCSAVNGWRPA